METVQLQCGQCKKLIAIRVEHMGVQVQCPHCKAVVQTPARVPEPAPSEATLATVDVHQPESIFAGAESSDSVIGEQATPQVELPESSSPSLPSATAAGTASGEADFSQFKKKQTFDKSVLPLLVLIFLVPYALMTTAFIAYLLLASGRSGHPFDYLRDPAPAKGGARPARLQPDPNQALAEHQRTTIGKAIKAGDLLVTPERVVLTADGDLKLILRAKNISAKTKFEPVNGVFLRPTKAGGEPYAFLESKTHAIEKISAVDLGYHKNPRASDAPRGDALLGPGDEITIALTTDLKYRLKHIPSIAKSADDNYEWRVQVRRGLVNVDGKDVSATTVIGVDFSNGEIEREKKS